MASADFPVITDLQNHLPNSVVAGLRQEHELTVGNRQRKKVRVAKTMGLWKMV